MFSIHKRPDWHLPESKATPESTYMNRRSFMKTVGLSGLMLGGFQNCQAQTVNPLLPPLPEFTINPDFTDPGRDLTDFKLATGYNNFYEFGMEKTDPAKYAKNFKIDPYTLTIDGLCDNPMTIDLDQIEKLGLEERTYRFRCVERWAMTIPWVGVPLQKLIAKAQPNAKARYVAMTCFLDPEKARGQNDSRYEWPYYEGLRLDEAMNELTLINTGYYGKRLLPQSGTPLRIITPWKYGYKGPKSVVKLTFTATQPKSYWNTAIPDEYKFYSNIDPEVPHPRWSQAMEMDLGKSRSPNKPTQLYNGYEKQVKHMYPGRPLKLY